MATLQVRSIDDRLYKALGARAAQDNRSISQEVVAIIKDFLSQPARQHENATDEFLHLCGSWQDNRNEAEIAAEIQQARTDDDERFREKL